MSLHFGQEVHNYVDKNNNNSLSGGSLLYFDQSHQFQPIIALNESDSTFWINVGNSFLAYSCQSKRQRSMKRISQFSDPLNITQPSPVIPQSAFLLKNKFCIGTRNPVFPPIFCVTPLTGKFFHLIE
jgi:hypothetical protein